VSGAIVHAREEDIGDCRVVDGAGSRSMTTRERVEKILSSGSGLGPPDPVKGGEMEIKDEIDRAVDDLFGKYTIKSQEVAKERNEIPLAQDQQNQVPPPDKAEVEQIKKLTALMLKRLNLAVKSENWGHRIYFSFQFVQIAMTIANRVTAKK
jgi:hypothetical protein